MQIRSRWGLPHGAVHRRGAALVATLLLFVIGCSDGNGEIAVSEPSSSSSTSSRPTTSQSVPSTTATTVDPNVEVVERYQAFWEARFDANQPPPDPDDPALAEYATGEQLASVIAETQRNLDEGLALRRPAGNSVRASRVSMVSLDGTTATLQECYVDDGVVFRPQSGEVVNDVVATHSVLATMQLVDGNWKLERTQLVQRWEGVAGCALAEDF